MVSYLRVEDGFVSFHGPLGHVRLHVLNIIRVLVAREVLQIVIKLRHLEVLGAEKLVCLKEHPFHYFVLEFFLWTAINRILRDIR